MLRDKHQLQRIIKNELYSVIMCLFCEQTKININ